MKDKNMYVNNKTYGGIKWHLHNGYLYNVKLGFQHRVVYEREVGPIPERYIIHHINNNPVDNRPENLQCMTQSAHMRLHSLGKTLSQETRNKMSAAHMGKTISQEHRDSISQANMGNKHNLGRTHSQETRNKMSAAHKRIWALRKQKGNKQ